MLSATANQTQFLSRHAATFVPSTSEPAMSATGSVADQAMSALSQKQTWHCSSGCPLWAKGGPHAAQQMPRHSITSSAHPFANCDPDYLPPEWINLINGLMEMTNENHNDLPLDDPAFKWAWEIYKEGDHLVHNRTTFFLPLTHF